MIKIAPSILSANFADLKSEIFDVQAQADYLHVDVMDGSFVPNITIGMPVVKAISEVTTLPLDVHLMIEKPHRYVEAFCKAGADLVVFHAEADHPQDIFSAITAIHAAGKKAGLALRPKSPAEVLIPYLSLLDMVLVMTVEPGFGGQSFMTDQLKKIAKVSQLLSQYKPDCELEVDGGIDPETAPLVKRAGANVLVAGSAVFGKADRNAAIASIRNAS